LEGGGEGGGGGVSWSDERLRQRRNDSSHRIDLQPWAMVVSNGHPLKAIGTRYPKGSRIVIRNEARVSVRSSPSSLFSSTPFLVADPYGRFEDQTLHINLLVDALRSLWGRGSML
jgi:hypothetical protein